MAKTTSCVLWLVWTKVVHTLPGAIPKAWRFRYCSTVPSSSWCGMLWLCLPSSCSPASACPLVSPHPSKAFYVRKCALEHTHCTLWGKAKKS